MSEFNLAAYDQQHNLTQRNVHAQPEVEWVSTTGASSSYGGGAYNYGSSNNLAAQYGTFEEEPPLLEGVFGKCSQPTDTNCMTTNHRHPTELGIDIPKILRKTQYVLTYRLNKHDLDDLDLGGPLVFVAILGAAHLLVRDALACKKQQHVVHHLKHRTPTCRLPSLILVCCLAGVQCAQWQYGLW